MEGRPVNQEEIKEVLFRATVDVIPREVLEGRLQTGQPLRVKLGIDPTGPRIHLGRAVPLRKLRRFQRMGHTVQLVVGDFTARIGDASDKTALRQRLSREQVEENMHYYKEQIGLILDLSRTEFHYNSLWLSTLSFSDVVELASHFTVAQMLERENFTLRYQAGKPIGLHEFMYPLMQGYDSVVLKTDVELGGTDQIFNLLAGRALQEAFGQPQQCVLTGPMIEGTDGRKMSTSWGNVINILDPSDIQYGRIMSIRDELMMRYFEACTDVPLAEIRELDGALARGDLAPMELKKRLAREIVALYHGEPEAWESQQHFESTAQRGERPEEIPVFEVPHTPQNIVELVTHCGLAGSKSEARRLIEQNGVQIDGVRMADPAARVVPVDGMLLRVGKRKYAELKCQ